MADNKLLHNIGSKHTYNLADLQRRFETESKRAHDLANMVMALKAHKAELVEALEKVHDDAEWYFNKLEGGGCPWDSVHITARNLIAKHKES